MTNGEIRKHINMAHTHVDHAMDELKVIGARISWQELLRIKRRLQDLDRLFELDEQEGKK